MKNFFSSILGLIVLALVILVVTFPASWLVMLFIGNLGVGLSYWGALPLGIIVSALIGAAGATDEIYVIPGFRRSSDNDTVD
jgi:hypothetical protein